MHRYLRAILADVIALNKPAFTMYCLPKTVGNHVSLTKHLSVWVTHVEILAMAAYTKSPVYTAIQKNAENDDTYYWAQYKMSDAETSRIIHPTDSHQDCLMAVNARKINPFEICLLNQSHYVVVLTIDNDLNSSPPYLGESSSSTVDAEQAVYTVS